MKQVTRLKIIISLFLVAFIISIAGGILTYQYFQRLYQVNADIIESYQTFRSADQSLISLNEAALEVGAYLDANDAEAIKNLPGLIVSAELNLANLKQLISDDTDQLALYTELKPLFDSKVAFLKHFIQDYDTGHKQEARQDAEDKSRLALTHHITQLIIEIKHIESGQLEANRVLFNDYSHKADYTFITVGIVSEILFLFGFILLRNYLKWPVTISTVTKNERKSSLE